MSPAPYYPFNQVQFGPAEYLTTEDLINVQKFGQASVVDHLLGARMRADEGAARYTRSYVHGSGGAPKPSATALTVSNYEGLVFADTAAGYSDGGDNHLVPYWMAADELAVTLAVGDATHPRIDLISIKIEYQDNDSLDEEDRFAEAVPGVVTTDTVVKRRKTVMTTIVTQGTPAATPTIALTPVGYRLWCTVLVPATHNAVFTASQLRDHRRPPGLDANLTICQGLDAHVHSPGATAWTVGATGQLEAIATGKIVTVFPRLRARHSARLIALRVMGSFPDSTVAMQLVRRSFAGGVVSDTNIGTSLTSVLTPIATSVEYLRPEELPLWGNGWEAGPAAYAAGIAHCTALGLKFTSGVTPSILNGIEWLFAAS